MAAEVIPFRVSNDALDDASELRRRLDGEGYLFIRRLVDPAPLWDAPAPDARRPAGWRLAPGRLQPRSTASPTSPRNAPKATPSTSPSTATSSGWRPSTGWPTHQAILALMEGIIGETVLPAPGESGPALVPAEHPAHDACPPGFRPLPGDVRDLHLLDAGGGLPDRARPAGGAGRLPPKRRDLRSPLRPGRRRPGRRHRSPARHVDEQRLCHRRCPDLPEPDCAPGAAQPDAGSAAGLAGQSLSGPKPAHRRTRAVAAPHRASRQTWDDIYPRWRSADLQYYWKDLPLTVVPSDDSRSGRGFEEALELARQGDELARPLLDRIVSRDPDSAQARAAREALDALDARAVAGRTP